METKFSKDPNQRAKQIVDLIVGDFEFAESFAGKNPAAVALGRKGGKKGGPARAKSLTGEKRREIAKKAADTRWGKSTQPLEYGENVKYSKEWFRSCTENKIKKDNHKRGTFIKYVRNGTHVSVIWDGTHTEQKYLASLIERA